MFLWGWGRDRASQLTVVEDVNKRSVNNKFSSILVVQVRLFPGSQQLCRCGTAQVLWADRAEGGGRNVATEILQLRFWFAESSLLCSPGSGGRIGACWASKDLGLSPSLFSSPGRLLPRHVLQGGPEELSQGKEVPAFLLAARV